MTSYTIGQLARLAETGIETIRFYEREGLIAAPPRRASGYRQYPIDALARLRFIRRAKALGFSLKDIRDLLELRVARGSTCADVRRRAETKIEDVRARINALKEMEKALKKLTASCRGRGPTGHCPFLDALNE
jgi:MerR family mercuric resistance operon transcriptional regulator